MTSHKPSLGYAEIIENKSAEILIPIIQRIVIPGSIIHMDEHKTYGMFTEKVVENYINRIKMEIKKRKGIKSGQHQDFLFEIVWQLNFSNF